MNRLEVFKTSDGKLCIEAYKNIDDEYPCMMLKNVQAIEALKSLKTNKIRDVLEELKYDEVTLVYRNGLINLNEFSQIMYKPGMRELTRNIKRFKEKQALKGIKKGKKVTRKNKYSKKSILAIGLVCTVLLTSSTIITNGENVNVVAKNPTSVTMTTEGFHSIKKEQTIEKNKNIEETEKKEKLTQERQDNQKNEVFEESENETVSIPYEDRSETEKAEYARNSYFDMIEKYSKMYGLDPNLVLAIATQERGVHSSLMDAGGATGLMQVQNSVWEYQTKTAYNFETEEYENFIITPEMLKEVSSNIRVGCTIFQECLKSMNYNIVAAIQCYNMGYGNMQTILKAYAMDTNRTVDEILNDSKDTGWLDYRYLVTQGDQEYVEHVLSWIGGNLGVSVLKDNKEQVCLNIKSDSKKISMM